MYLQQAVAAIPSATHPQPLGNSTWQATGLDAQLSAASDPAYTAPTIEDDSAPITVEFPW